MYTGCYGHNYIKEPTSQTYFMMSVLLHITLFPDPAMTVENVTQVFNKIEGDKWMVMKYVLDIPSPLVEEIQKRYTTEADQNHACADYFVNCYPNASWENLTFTMYFGNEFVAAKESKSFMSIGKYCHYITYWYNCYAH